MRVCYRVAKTPHFRLPSAELVPAARSGHGHAREAGCQANGIPF